MKKHLLVSCLVLLCGSLAAQITFQNTFVPLYTQGKSPTNNERIPFFFRATLTGLTPGATYRFYTAMDSLNASASSNGAGNSLLINQVTASFRRSTANSLNNVAGHDSLVADANGQFSGWFGVEPTANGRFTAGNVLYPKIMLNNGSGGTSVATRVLLVNDPVKVLSFGTTSQDATQGSAVYDSINTVGKNFVALYNDVVLPSRPLTIAVVENDMLQVNLITSVAAFYRNNVDSMASRWGTIIPNYNSDGVRIIETRDFSTGNAIGTITDADGIWCGMNTVDPSTGLTASYLNALGNITLDSAYVPDTMAVTLADTMQLVTYTAPNTSVDSVIWNFGDNTANGSGSSAIHTYSTGGTFYVTVTVYSAGGCTDTYLDSVFVTNPLGIVSEQALTLQLSPNPASDYVQIENKFGKSRVEILDLRGALLFSQTIADSRTRISVQSFSPGVYIVRLTDNTGRTGITRLVIQ